MRQIVAAQPMTKGFFTGSIYKQVQLSQMGVSDVHRQSTDISAWCKALQFIRHSDGFVRQQVWEPQAMASYVLREQTIKVHQRKLSAGCASSSLDKHFRQITPNRATPNHRDPFPRKRLRCRDISLGKISVVNSYHRNHHYLKTISRVLAIGQPSLRVSTFSVIDNGKSIGHQRRFDDYQNSICLLSFSILHPLMNLAATPRIKCALPSQNVPNRTWRPVVS